MVFEANGQVYENLEPESDHCFTLILTLSERGGSLTPLDQARREVDSNLNKSRIIN